MQALLVLVLQRLQPLVVAVQGAVVGGWLRFLVALAVEAGILTLLAGLALSDKAIEVATTIQVVKVRREAGRVVKVLIHQLLLITVQAAQLLVVQ
jgi:hypothetical protein